MTDRKCSGYCYAWEDIDEAVKRIAEFKKNVYIEAVKKFKPVVEG